MAVRSVPPHKALSILSRGVRPQVHSSGPPPHEPLTIGLYSAQSDAEGPSVEYRKPTRAVMVQADMPHFLQSPCYKTLMDFILRVNDAVKKRKISDTYPISDVINRIVAVLQKLDTWITEIPPTEQPTRFGNKAFRTWLTRVIERAEDLMREILPLELAGAAIELASYFTESWGNATRIDYGTGHETTFVAWLACLEQIGLLKPADFEATAFRAFNAYLGVVRRLLMVYFLEPAGSHGVWSLDDYSFIPFFWGSAQCIDHPEIRPNSVLDKPLVERLSNEYLYLAAVRFINKFKTGPFAEHSPILYNISGVESWTKINTGMSKMYQAEVLGKFPVMQHFLFGTILRYE